MTVHTESAAVDVTARGRVGRSAAAYARRKVTLALAVAHGPVTEAHVVLASRSDPAVPRPAVAEVTARTDGLRLRVMVTAPTMHEAVDELEGRLRRRLVQLQERERGRHRWTAVAGAPGWRHGGQPREQAPYFPRPVEDREVVRHKSFASATMSIDEAAFEMDLLDHDFFLYRDAGTGHAALVQRRPEGGFLVQGASVEAAAGDVLVGPAPPPLTDFQARQRLEAGDERFVFYLDAESGAGRVLYHRYDGHYGLVELAEPVASPGAL